MYIKIESMRLSYFENNQDKLKVEYYKGVADSVLSGVQKGGYVGTHVYLPPTFISGPRDMHHRYFDSMSLVQELGSSRQNSPQISPWGLKLGML
ncbi:hypothetical protein LIER_29286 [Lithospermum erythrorhizon]|uniref:Helitron helicase-like domain-containing protein n=1 Tax=Lithospermum erythrorhizon TaxID=34254 RepID=A0AAV3RKA8_LITER